MTRLEAVCRAYCRAHGIDPDHQGPPYPEGQPVWMMYRGRAEEFIAMHDAAAQHPPQSS